MNLRERNETGVIKIAVFETYSNGKEDAIKPIGGFLTSPYAQYANHAENVIRIIRTYVPNAEIYLLPFHKSEARKYVVDNKIPIANISLATPAVYEHMEEMSKNTFIVQAVGNDGSEGEVVGAQWEKCCAVGAANSSLEPQNYSGYGLGAVDTVSVTGLKYGGDIGLHGTSFAAPVVTGLIAQYFIWHKKVTGVYPSVKSAFDFVVRNSHDIWEDGVDLRTGNGLFRLPQEFKVKKIVTPKGSDVGKIITYTENQPNFVEEFDMVMPTQIIDGRMMASLRGIGNGFDKVVTWNSVKNEATFV